MRLGTLVWLTLFFVGVMGMYGGLTLAAVGEALPAAGTATAGFAAAAAATVLLARSAGGTRTGGPSAGGRPRPCDDPPTGV